MKYSKFFVVALLSSLLCACGGGTSKESEPVGNKWEIGKGNPASVKAEVVDNILYIKGKGDMKDFAKSSETPWYDVREDLTDIKIEEGITYIGKYAFFTVPVPKLVVPKSVEEINSMAINDETSLYIYEGELELDLIFDPIVYIYQEEVPETHDVYWQSDYSKNDIVKEIVEDEEEKLLWHFVDEEATPWKKQKVLFIGNSFTYRNGVIDYSSGVPGVFNDVAEDLGYCVETYSITGPGWYLDNHAKATDTCGKQVDALLKAVDDFDFIVLQEQSVNPFENYSRFLQGVTALKNKINSTQDHAKIYLYETWGSPYSADERSITVPEMEMKLRKAYTDAGTELKLDVTYVGRAFTDVYLNNSSIYLWASDNRHQGYTGAYLSGCTHVANMLGGDVRNTKFINNTKYNAPALANDTLKVLRQAAYDSAHDIIHDNPTVDPDPTPSDDKNLEIAVWGRWINESQFKTLYDGFEAYCKKQSISLDGVGYTYYPGPNTSDQYYYIAAFSSAAKAKDSDVVFPCATNLNTQDDSVYKDQEMTITPLGITINGKTDRCIAKINENDYATAFYNYVLSDEGKGLLDANYQPQEPSGDPVEGDKVIKIACWGRFMKEAKFNALIDDYKAYCKTNNLDVDSVIGQYYVGQANSDPYFYIADFSLKVKNDGDFDIVLPCADNFATSQSNVPVTSLTAIEVYGQTNRRVATTNDEALTLSVVTYIQTDSAVAILALAD